MATPEQNMLLAMQLFQPTAQTLQQIGDARTNVALKMALMDRDERNRQAAAEASYRRAVDVENLRLKHDDARIEAAEARSDARILASEKRAQTAAGATAQRAKDAQQAKDKADIENEFDRLYPQYAQAAARAGITIKQREDYPATRSGLGQLAADLKTAEVGFQTSRESSAATALLGGLEDKRAELTQAKAALDELSKPSPEDQKFARQRAAEAVQQAIEANSFPGSEKIKKDARTKGISALRAGNDFEAKKFLGESAMAAYETEYEKTLMALPNTRSRLQLRAQGQQQLLALQRETSMLESDLRKAAATNPALAKGLTDRRSAAQIFSPEAEPPPRQRTLGEIFGDRATPTAAATPNRVVAPVPVVNLLTGDDPLIAQENQRRLDAAATPVRQQYQERADTWNNSVDQLTALQRLAAGIRTGSPAAVSQATNPMGGYIPGVAVNPSAQAGALSTILQQQAEQQKRVEADRLRMLFLEPDSQIIGRQ